VIDPLCPPSDRHGSGRAPSDWPISSQGKIARLSRPPRMGAAARVCVMRPCGSKPEVHHAAVRCGPSGNPLWTAMRWLFKTPQGFSASAARRRRVCANGYLDNSRWLCQGVSFVFDH